jgi:dimeric dUTPase (all-alpha-NTP-PPase superfamily)
MNDKILNAIAGALCLLADEYKVALQSKHWSTMCEESKTTKEEEASAQLHFLVSVINDSYRLSTIHLQPLKDVETQSISIHEITKSVTTVFDGVIDAAVNHIVRTMFSDLNIALVNFENLWQEERRKGGTNGAPLTIITTTLSDYFNELFGAIESKYFATIVTMCLDTCVMRYLIFLRDYSLRDNKEILSNKDVSRFAIDCANLKTCFLCPALPLDVTLRDILNQKLTSVTNLVDLITQDYEGEHCQEVIHGIAKKYN